MPLWYSSRANITNDVISQLTFPIKLDNLCIDHIIATYQPLGRITPVGTDVTVSVV
jgi:hypothetical protein